MVFETRVDSPRLRFSDRFLPSLILLETMRSSYKRPIMVISLLTLISSVYAADDGNTKWAQKLLDAIKARDSMIPNINAFVGGINDQSIKNLITTLETFPSQLEGLDSLGLTAEEQDGALATEIRNQQHNSLVTNRFSSSNLETNYKDRGFGFLLKTLKDALSPTRTLRATIFH